MVDSTLVLPMERPGGLDVVVNFGLHSGRTATQAEIYRLGEALLPRLGEVEIVAEDRHEVDSGGEATVHQIRITLPEGAEPITEDLLEIVEAWAQDCIAERRVLKP